jgi:hypothetical protein
MKITSKQKFVLIYLVMVAILAMCINKTHAQTNGSFNNIRMRTASAADTTTYAVQGQMYFNQSTKQLRIYKNGAWQNVGTGTSSGGTTTPAAQSFTGNGATTVYTLTDPSSVSISGVFMGGQRFTEGVHYTKNNTAKTVTFTTAPTNGITFDVEYFSGVSISGGGGSGSVTNLTATNNTGQTWTITNPTSTPNLSLALTNAAVGLGNVDNTSDATKNSASATLTNKTISGASNTLSNIAESSVTNLVSDLAGKASSTLGTLTSDPVNLPATGNTIDQFGSRTLGGFQNLLSTYTLPVVSANNNLVIDGNSNGYGSLLPSPSTQNYGVLTRAILGTGNYTFTNFSVPGQTTQQLTARQSTTLAAFNGSKTRNFAVAFEIENDAFVNTGLTASQLYTNMSNWYAATKAAGFYTIAMTAPNRAYYGTTGLQANIDVNNRITAANALLKATTTSYDAIIDVQSIPRLSNQRSRVGFSYDDVHYNVSGHMVLADAVVSKIRANLGQQDYTPPRFASWDGNNSDRSMVLGTTSNFPLGLISNGKIRMDVQTNGTVAVLGDVTPPDGTLDASYRFGVGTNQAIGLMVTPGLTATNNSDILSALTIQPSYFDNGAYTGTLNDMFRINSYQDNSYGLNLYRFDNVGRIIHTPTYTATTGDIARTWRGTITGQSTGTSTGDQFQTNFTYAANNTSYVAAYVKPVITRGAFTGTATTGLLVDTGSGAIPNDIGLKVSVTDGTGIDMGNHAGTGTALSIVSSSTGTGVAVGMTNAASVPLVVYKTTGSNAQYVGRFILQSTTGTTGLTSMLSYERTPSGGLGVGGGMTFPFTLNTASGNRISHNTDMFWTDVTNGAEKSTYAWRNMVSGTLAERMRLEGNNLSVGFGASPTATVQIKNGHGGAGSAPIKLTAYNITTTGASGTGTVATLTFSAQPRIPFEVGSTITISGVTPAGYNGTGVVTACTTIAVSYTNSTTGSQTVAGTVKSGIMATPENGAIEADESNIYYTDNSGNRSKLNSSENVNAKTANYTIVPGSDIDNFFTNTGAVGAVNFTLPTATKGQTYSFYIDAAQTFTITAGASTTIRIAGTASASAGNITSSTVGNAITLVAISATQWVAKSHEGTWTIN